MSSLQLLLVISLLVVMSSATIPRGFFSHDFFQHFHDKFHGHRSHHGYLTDRDDDDYSLDHHDDKSQTARDDPIAQDASNFDAAICGLPKQIGVCRAFWKRFYYSTKERKCLQFVYGGCAGNENNFWEMDLCRARCDPSYQPTVTTAAV